MARLAQTAVIAAPGTQARACASVEFWNASKIFFSAITSLVFLSTAFHTMPYACGHRRKRTRRY